ncbi:MAG: cysteine methyltransferase [Chromatiales bacterium]|jgi:methylated-DNA-protein-cysteine methyltransferase-like protein|nr:MAG: cysteine methyltransferase [Chromatiales bacterium]
MNRTVCRTAAEPETVEQRHERIRAAVCRIPTGCVASYGDVAAIAGMPGRARLVGRVLRDSPAARELPWHRVLGSSGKLAFAEHSAGFLEQAERLIAEGVDVVRGRVDMRRYRWAPDLDEMLWKPSAGWDQGGGG